MADQKLLTVREVAHILHLTEKDVMDLAESGAVPAYKVGGVYLRFKREQVEEYRRKFLREAKPAQPVLWRDRLFDFFYFNDFYIISLALIALLLYIIFT